MRFVGLAIRNFKEIYRDPLSALLGVLLPVALLTLFTLIGQSLPLPIFRVANLAPAMAVFSLAFLLMFVAMLVAKDRAGALLARLMTTPLRPVDCILAYALPLLPLAWLQIMACFATAAVLGMPWSLGLIPAVAIQELSALVCISLGLILGSLCSEGQIAGIGSLLINVIGIFSGTWIDLHALGGNLERFGYFLPFAHAVDASRDLLQGIPDPAGGLHLGVVALWALLLSLGAVLAFRWSTRQR